MHLKEFRRTRRISQVDCANYLGVDRSTIQRWEKGPEPRILSLALMEMARRFRALCPSAIRPTGKHEPQAIEFMTVLPEGDPEEE